MKTEVIYYRQSFLQSFMGDLVTFIWLFASMWFSHGSDGWTFVCGLVFLLFLLAKTPNASMKRFASREKMLDYLNNEEEA